MSRDLVNLVRIPYYDTIVICVFRLRFPWLYKSWSTDHLLAVVDSIDNLPIVGPSRKSQSIVPVYDESLGWVILLSLQLSFCVVFAQSILDDELFIVINPFFVFPQPILFPSFNFELPSCILEPLLLNDLFNFCPHR